MSRLLMCLITLLSLNTQAQTYFNQPSEANSKDASLGYHDGYNTDNQNYGNDLYFKAFCIPGASFGSNSNRGLIEFNLSSIPANAQVINASINLYATGYINSVLPGHFGANSSKLYRVLSTWNESSVTWNSCPTVNSSDFVVVPASSSYNQDYSLNITNWAQDIIQNPASNFGFLLKLDQENPNNSAALAFYSSSSSVMEKRPSIEIEYVIDNDTICYSTGNDYSDVDASLGYHDNYGTADNNYSTDEYLKAFCFPGAAGGQNTNRALLKFDLSGISSSSSIATAKLSLHGAGYINSTLTGHLGDNQAILQKVSENWNLNTVTWNTQPSASAIGQINLPVSTSFDQDYEIDITSWVSSWVLNPSMNNGMLLQLLTEDPNNAAALAFFSSNYSELDERPTLCVTFREDNLSVSMVLGEDFQITVYPNPSSGNFTLKTNGIIAKRILLVDATGRIIYENAINEKSDAHYLTITDYSPGIYQLVIETTDSKLLSERIELF